MMRVTFSPANWRQVRGGSIKCNQETQHRTHHHMKPWAAALNGPNVKDLSSHTTPKRHKTYPTSLNSKTSSLIASYNLKKQAVIIIHSPSWSIILQCSDVSLNAIQWVCWVCTKLTKGYKRYGWYGIICKFQSSCEAQQRLAMDYHAQMVA